MHLTDTHVHVMIVFIEVKLNCKQTWKWDLYGERGILGMKLAFRSVLDSIERNLFLKKLKKNRSEIMSRLICMFVVFRLKGAERAKMQFSSIAYGTFCLN